MVDKFLQCKKTICEKWYGSSYGKPPFLDVPDTLSDDYNLSAFFGDDSWSFFKLMKLSYEILENPIQDWPTDDNFEKGRYIIDSF